MSFTFKYSSAIYIQNINFTRLLCDIIKRYQSFVKITIDWYCVCIYGRMQNYAALFITHSLAAIYTKMSLDGVSERRNPCIEDNTLKIHKFIIQEIALNKDDVIGCPQRPVMWQCILFKIKNFICVKFMHAFLFCSFPWAPNVRSNEEWIISKGRIRSGLEDASAIKKFGDLTGKQPCEMVYNNHNQMKIKFVWENSRLSRANIIQGQHSIMSKCIKKSVLDYKCYDISHLHRSLTGIMTNNICF